MARFPFGIPNSWYLVAYADEIERGTVKPLPYLGRNMIAIRDGGGAVSVLDGYCPHLGANLAVVLWAAGPLQAQTQQIRIRPGTYGIVQGGTETLP